MSSKKRQQKNKKRQKRLSQKKHKERAAGSSFKRFERFVERVLAEIEKKDGLEKAREFEHLVKTRGLPPIAGIMADRRDYITFKFLMLFTTTPDTDEENVWVDQKKYLTDAEMLRAQHRVQLHDTTGKGMLTVVSALDEEIQEALGLDLAEREAPVEELFLVALTGVTLHGERTGIGGFLPDGWTKPFLLSQPSWTPLFLAQRFFGISHSTRMGILMPG
jgi:hypothetical protein